MKAVEMNMTPKMASEMLANNHGNRPISNRFVSTLTDYITRGQWKCNGQPVVVGKSGRLLDGQHRLHAIIASGKTVPVMVVHDIDDDVFATLDTGRKRTGRDVAAMRGMRNPAHIAAVARLCKWYGEDENDDPYSTIISNQDVLDYAEANPNIDIYVDLMLGNKFTHKMTSGYPAALYVISQKGGRGLLEFHNAVASGENLRTGHPALALRNWVINRRIAKAKVRSDGIMCATIQAWNYYARGKDMVRMQLADKRPMPVAKR